MTAAGFDFLQLLPLNEMAEGQDSPYSALSAMALDPLFIAPAKVPELEGFGAESFLDPVERDRLEAARQAPAIQYATIRALKTRVFRAAFELFLTDEWRPRTPRGQGLEAFIERESWWLSDTPCFARSAPGKGRRAGASGARRSAIASPAPSMKPAPA